jgi:hypothetical protein
MVEASVQASSFRMADDVRLGNGGPGGPPNARPNGTFLSLQTPET